VRPHSFWNRAILAYIIIYDKCIISVGICINSVCINTIAIKDILPRLKPVVSEKLKKPHTFLHRAGVQNGRTKFKGSKETKGS
jgi:hypothetical protein